MRVSELMVGVIGIDDNEESRGSGVYGEGWNMPFISSSKARS